MPKHDWYPLHCPSLVWFHISIIYAWEHLYDTVLYSRRQEQWPSNWPLYFHIYGPCRMDTKGSDETKALKGAFSTVTAGHALVWAQLLSHRSRSVHVYTPILIETTSINRFQHASIKVYNIKHIQLYLSDNVLGSRFRIILALIISLSSLMADKKCTLMMTVMGRHG